MNKIVNKIKSVIKNKSPNMITSLLFYYSSFSTKMEVHCDSYLTILKCLKLVDIPSLFVRLIPVSSDTTEISVLIFS